MIHPRAAGQNDLIPRQFNVDVFTAYYAIAIAVSPGFNDVYVSHSGHE
jgi:hypothetical protein